MTSPPVEIQVGDVRRQMPAVFAPLPSKNVDFGGFSSGVVIASKRADKKKKKSTCKNREIFDFLPNTRVGRAQSRKSERPKCGECWVRVWTR